MQVLIINKLCLHFRKKLYRFMLSYYFLLCQISNLQLGCW